MALTEAPELPIAQEDGAVLVRAPLSGWLLKRKSDKAVSRVISSTNRRYFTLDFDAQVFYYAHSENSRNVSQPVPFRHLLSVEGLFNPEGEEVSARQGSKHSVGSGFSRLGKILSRRPSGADEHGFTLHLAGRDMELMCTSKEEADTWIDAIKEAIASGSSEKRRNSIASDDARAPSTAPGSSVNSPSSPRSEVAPEDSDDEDEVPLAGTLVVGTKSEEATPQEHVDAVQVAEIAEVAVSTHETSTPAETAAEETDAAEETVAEKFEENIEETAIRCESEAHVPSEPSPSDEVDEVVVAMDGAGGVAAVSHDMAWDAESRAPQKSASSRYADKGEGLTLAQRLSQLDFSDDEDEERSHKQSKKDEEAAAVKSPQADGAVEEVQAFVQEADSDED